MTLTKSSPTEESYHIKEGYIKERLMTIDAQEYV